jgi:ribokinase
MKVAIVGSANWDLYVEADRLPAEGETLSATGGGVIRCGGKGANTATACSTTGGSATFIGQVGGDWPGDILKT